MPIKQLNNVKGKIILFFFANNKNRDIISLKIKSSEHSDLKGPHEVADAP